MPEGANILYEAVRAGNIKKAYQLLESGNCDINAQDDKGKTALHWAIQKGEILFAIKLLSSNSVDITILAIYEETVLHFAAKYNHPAICKKILSKIDNPNLQNKDGETPLHQAALRGHTKVVKILLSHAKINCDIKTKEYKKTTLHYAAHYGYTPIVKRLLNKKAHTYARDSTGWIPLHAAIVRAHQVQEIDKKERMITCIKLLLPHGIGTNMLCTHMVTRLFQCCCAIGDESILAHFILSGLSVPRISDIPAVLNIGAMPNNTPSDLRLLAKRIEKLQTKIKKAFDTMTGLSLTAEQIPKILEALLCIDRISKATQQNLINKQGKHPYWQLLYGMYNNQLPTELIDLMIAKLLHDKSIAKLSKHFVIEEKIVATLYYAFQNPASCASRFLQERFKSQWVLPTVTEEAPHTLSWHM